MVRRTKAAAAVTREHLLDAAQRLFREHGVTRTSLAEVANAAGVTRGAVYWHFKDKAALFTAMCDRATLPLDAMLEAAAGDNGDNALGSLRDLMVGALQYLANDTRTQAVFEVIFHKTELCGALAAAAGCRERERADCLHQVEKLVRQAANSGQLPSDTDAALATQMLHACISGLMREWVLDPRAFDLAKRAPALVDCIIAGLVAVPPRSDRVLPRVRPRAISPA